MSNHHLEQMLKKYFQYASFRSGQKEIIHDILNGRDVLGVLPTGSGKSICYQLPAQLLDGVTIVVSPLISLMVDQVKELKAINIKTVVALNSFIDPISRSQIYENLHKYKLIYVSPELLQQRALVKSLQRIKVSLFVIDEAHCISQWGHEFRPDYLKLAPIINQLGDPTVLALSATATKFVQKDIVESLQRPKMLKHIYPMDRNNIALTVQEVANNNEKLKIITEMLANYEVPTIIYFSSRQAAEELALVLSERLSNHRIAYYHGGMEPSDRISIQQQFLNNQLDIICCTSAFGMGINKNDIRFIIHYHFPPMIESYIQEIGRAGRDGKASVSIVLYCKTDIQIPDNMINSELPTTGQIRHTFNSLQNFATDTIHEETFLPKIGLNEIQWRFLHYQLEKHGIMKENKIQINIEHSDWDSVMKQIIQIRNDRFQLKENKLIEMIGLMNEEDCLRKQLYRKFQDSYAPPLDQCCSNCGFTLHKWDPIHRKKTFKHDQPWQLKLQQLLLNEE